MNVAQHLLDTFRAQGDKVAIVDARGRATSYTELVDRSSAIRQQVRALYLPRHSRVTFQTAVGVDFTTAAIALLAEGLVPVGIELSQGDDVYRDRARFVAANAVVRSQIVARAQAIDAVRRRLPVAVPPRLADPTITLPKRLVRECGPEPVADVDGKDTALIVFTGGTTDRPKAVELSHRAVLSYFENLASLPEWNGLRSIVADHPQQVIYGLAHGKTVYVSKARSTHRATHIAELLFDRGVEGYFGSPTNWTAILDQRIAGSHDDSIQPTAVLLGGAPVTRSVLKRLEHELPKSNIRCLYGMTEVGLVAHISGPDKLTRLSSGVTDDPVGTLLPGVKVTVAEDHELFVETPAQFSGYVGDDTPSGQRPFATGDLGTLVGRELSLLGRKKDMIVQDGVNLSPGQFEPRLLELKHDGSRAFNAVALVRTEMNDESGDEAFSLAFVPANTRVTNAVALELASTVLPIKHAPVGAVRLESMPVTGRQNKVDRSSLERVVAINRRTKTRTATSLSARHSLMRTELERRTGGSIKGRIIAGLTSANLALVERNRRGAVSDARNSAPIFVLGHQRSGTTAMHRLLDGYPGVATLALIDMLAPHPLGWTATRPLRWLGSKPAVRKRASVRDGRTELGRRHRLGLTNPEEDEFLLAALGLSGFLPSLFGETLGDAHFDAYRDRAGWDVAEIDELIELYDDVVRSWRAHQRIDNNIQMVAKNPAFGPIANRLFAHYPQASFVVMLRDAPDAIASRLDLVQTIHRRPLTPDEVEVIVNDSMRQLEGLATALAAVPDERTLLVPFEAFIEDWSPWVRRAALLGGLSDTFDASNLPTQSHQPRKIDLQGFGWSREQIDAAVPAFRLLRTRSAAAEHEDPKR